MTAVILTFAVHASGSGTYSPGAFGAQIGTLVPVRSGGAVIGFARVTAADVSDDGGFVVITAELGPDCARPQ